MEAWKGADAVILIDAARSGAPPGTIHRLDPIRQPLRTGMFQDSTHAFSIPQAIELGRALNQLPPRIVVYGIEGRDFSAGTKISPEVQAALPEVAAQIFGEVASLVSGAR